MNEEASQPSAPVAVSEQEIWDQLRNCYDPEIPLNIVDLGLIYDVIVNGSIVDVKMTLTAPGCHMGAKTPAKAKQKTLPSNQLKKANAKSSGNPPGNQAR